MIELTVDPQGQQQHQAKEPEVREESPNSSTSVKLSASQGSRKSLQAKCYCSSCCCCSNRLDESCKLISSSATKPSEQRRAIMSRASCLIWSYFIAELIGTFLLVIIGDGAIAAFVVTKKDVDMFTACFAFGVGAMVATFAAAKISGAHINPAASVAFALNGQLSWRLVPVYMLAQYLGGFLAALVLMLNYSEAIRALDGGSHSAFGSENSTGMIFATYPGSWVSVWTSLFDQIIGTAVLLFSLSAIGDKRNLNLETKHQPIYIAFIIGLVCVAFNPNCGAIFNPARDLAPRILTYLFGYQTAWSPVEGLYWLTAGVLGPHIGAILGVFAYRLLIGRALTCVAREEEEASDQHHLQHQHHCASAKHHHSLQMQASKLDGNSTTDYGASVR